jgi:hypothetical protein
MRFSLRHDLRSLGGNTRRRVGAQDRRRLSVLRVTLALAVSLTATLGSRPQASGELSVPAAIQAAIFKKIFGYDHILSAIAPRIRIVYAPEYASAAKDLEKAFRAVELSVDLAPIDQIHQLGSANVVYVLAATVPAALKDLCAKSKVLSVSSLSSLAYRGDGSVALRMKGDGKPGIVVHMGRLAAEGHELSASLLQLVEVVR